MKLFIILHGTRRDYPHVCLEQQHIEGFISEARKKISDRASARAMRQVLVEEVACAAGPHHHFYSVLADINEFAPPVRRLDPDLNIMRIIEHPITQARPS